MTTAVFRLELPDGVVRLARGDTAGGPSHLLPAELTVAMILQAGADALASAAAGDGGDPVPAGSHILAPIDTQEVWAAGVTYERSLDARVEEAIEPSVYDRVYSADRPELFFKSPGSRVRGPGDTVGIRADSAWDVPEPELALIVTADLEIAGLTIGNDMSSRTIEGENPLYLPQAKIYEASCGLGPALVPLSAVTLPIEIRLEVVRSGARVFDGTTSSARLHRRLEELVECLGRAMAFPDGVVLLTGTGIVPDASFSLQVGDLVRIAAGPLGVLENPVMRVGRPVPAPAPAR